MGLFTDNGIFLCYGWDQRVVLPGGKLMFKKLTNVYFLVVTALLMASLVVWGMRAMGVYLI